MSVMCQYKIVLTFTIIDLNLSDISRITYCIVMC